MIRSDLAERINYNFRIIFEIIDQCALANRDRSVTKARSIESHRALALLATTILALKVESNVVFKTIKLIVETRLGRLPFSKAAQEMKKY